MGIVTSADDPSVAQPQKFSTTPVAVEAMFFPGGARSSLAITNWVFSNGGRAYYNPEVPEYSEYIAGIALGNLFKVMPGEYLARDEQGNFFNLSGSVFEQAHSAMEER